MDIAAVAIIAFAIGWIVGGDAQRKFNRRMSDIERRKREIQWPIGHKDEK